MKNVTNLDIGIEESYQFILKGNTYSFKQLNTEEMAELKALITADEDDKQEENLKKFLFSFITPVTKDAPSFQEVYKIMLHVQWSKFLDMVMTKLKG